MPDIKGRMYSEMVSSRAAPATTDRRDALLAWIRQQTHYGKTAKQIADVSGIYDGLRARRETAMRDLEALRWLGLVRTDGRWWPVTEDEQYDSLADYV